MEYNHQRVVKEQKGARLLGEGQEVQAESERRKVSATLGLDQPTEGFKMGAQRRPMDTADIGHKSVVRAQTVATVKRSKQVMKASYKSQQGSEKPLTNGH